MRDLDIQFDEPDAVMFREVATWLPALPVVSEADIQDAVGADRRSDAKTGNAQEALADLRVVFERDFAENLRQSEEVSWSFNYRLTWFDHGASKDGFVGLGIFTRLFKPDQDGGIIYGAVVYRTSDDTFVYWDDL